MYAAHTCPNRQVVQSMKRVDGRQPNQLRAIACEHRALNRADGSTRFNHNQTCVLVAVNGPKEVESKKEQVSEAVVEVTFKPRSGLPGPKEKEMEAILRQTLESVILLSMHPRTAISVIFQVLVDDGSVLAACINGAYVALMDAGIPLRLQVTSVTCAISADGVLLLDPVKSEEALAASCVTVGINSVDGGVVCTHCSGPLPEESLFQCIAAATEGAKTVLAFVRMTFEKQLEKNALRWANT